MNYYKLCQTLDALRILTLQWLIITIIGRYIDNLFDNILPWRIIFWIFIATYIWVFINPNK